MNDSDIDDSELNSQYIHQLEKRIQNHQKHISKMMKDLEEANAESIQQKESHARKTSELEDYIKSLEHELSKINRESKNKDATIKQMKQDKEEYQKKIHRLQSDSSKSNEKYESLITENKQLNQEINHLKQNQNNKTESLNEQIKKSKSKIKENESIIEKQAKQIKTMQARIDSLNSNGDDVHFAQSTISQLKSQLAAIYQLSVSPNDGSSNPTEQSSPQKTPRTMYNAISSILISQREQIRKLKSELSEIKGEKENRENEYKSQITLLEEQLENQKEVSAQLNNQLDKAVNEMDSRWEENNFTMNEKSQHTQELEANLKEKDEALEKKNQKIKELEEYINKLDKERNTMLESHQQSLKKLNKKLYELNQLNVRMQHTIQTENDHAVKYREQFEKEVNGLQDQLEEQYSKNKQIKEHMDTLNHSYKQEVNKLVAEIYSLKEQNNKLIDHVVNANSSKSFNISNHSNYQTNPNDSNRDNVVESLKRENETILSHIRKILQENSIPIPDDSLITSHTIQNYSNKGKDDGNSHAFSDVDSNRHENHTKNPSIDHSKDDEIHSLHNIITQQIKHNEQVEKALNSLQTQRSELLEKMNHLHVQSSPSTQSQNVDELRKRYEQEVDLSNKRREMVEKDLHKSRHQLHSLMKKYKSIKDKYIKQSKQQQESESYSMLNTPIRSPEQQKLPSRLDFSSPQPSNHSPVVSSPGWRRNSLGKAEHLSQNPPDVSGWSSFLSGQAFSPEYQFNSPVRHSRRRSASTPHKRKKRKSSKKPRT
eukprot:gb/GECH01001164.1/.p1 GENE.gb/GECH01001164.1/~~gb/GECH01001164.1/.p1  ORF type:complete len:770 (+),score=250.85 gb/GECH01001164.1/:1-2310(+)